MTLFSKEMRYCPIPISFILMFGILTLFLSDHEHYGKIVGVTAVVMGIVIMYQSVMIAQTTKQKGKIPLSYLCLGIAYLAYAAAELTWLILDMQGIETYPSTADHIYSVYFVFSIAHVYITYRFFVSFISVKEKILIPSLITALIMIYGVCFIVWESDMSLFLHGGVFVMFASTLLILTGVLIFKLKNTKLFGAWAVIGIAISLGALGDLWYYPLDLFGMYNYGHPVDIIWVTSDALLIFALNIHRKLI